MLLLTSVMADIINKVSREGESGEAGSIRLAGRFTPEWGSVGVAGKRELVAKMSGVDEDRRVQNVSTAVADVDVA